MNNWIKKIRLRKLNLQRVAVEARQKIYHDAVYGVEETNMLVLKMLCDTQALLAQINFQIKELEDA